MCEQKAQLLFMRCWNTCCIALTVLCSLLTKLILCSPDRGKLADPFYRLEHQEEDLQKKKEAEPVLVRLQRISDERNLDDYALNKALRAKLRVCHDHI